MTNHAWQQEDAKTVAEAMRIRDAYHPPDFHLMGMEVLFTIEENYWYLTCRRCSAKVGILHRTQSTATQEEFDTSMEKLTGLVMLHILGCKK